MEECGPWYKTTAIGHVLRRARLVATNLFSENLLAQDTCGAIYCSWRAHRRGASSITDALPDLRAALDDYQRNVHRIIDFAQSQSIRVVFLTLTQPALWRDGLTKAEEDLLWLGGVGEFQTEPNRPYYSPRALAEGMARYNGALKQVCDSRNVECLDLAAKIERSTDNFFDDVHFTEQGSRAVGAELQTYFRVQPPFVRPDEGKR